MKNPLTLTVPSAPMFPSETYAMGSSRRPDGATLTVTRQSLQLNGKPWMPVMGEFHYARYPASEWREELLKMKAGGLELIASYVFWIHHEETEGSFDWSGQRSLRNFVALCGELGLHFVARIGPWCHGEVRNGGLPDWILGTKTRTDDPPYLKKVAILYGEISKQLVGLLWKDGGPVVGAQIENEYGGRAEHLLTLKKLAREAGIDVPLYTRTGWPGLASPMPFGELLPLFGVYAEGFWDRELKPMPGNYWSGFHFSHLRTDSAIATDILGKRDAKDDADAARYPYLTCEIGGGMPSSYHRRIALAPADIEATVLVKLGSGSTLPGYYMYHGGTNPEGKTTLMESQATGYWNDLPVKTYDFGAPLGEFGQVRPHYHRLRRLHLFLQDFGEKLATMPAFMPDQRPTGKDDLSTLRWCVRSDSKSGFVFVNNHQRGTTLAAKEGIQFKISLPKGELLFPDQPVTVPAGSRFFWPFALDLGNSLTLKWATAQPLCTVTKGPKRTVFFAETPGVHARFAFEKTIKALKPGQSLDLGSVQICLLSEADSLQLYKLERQVYLSPASLSAEGILLHLRTDDPKLLTLKFFDGESFRGVEVSKPRAQKLTVSAEVIRPAGPPRTIPRGKISTPVATAPEDADFAQAALWKIVLPPSLDLGLDPLLRIHYTGDVARLTLGGKLLTDNFYNGQPFEIGLQRFGAEILTGALQLAVLPMPQNPPILLPEPVSGAKLVKIELLARYHATVP